MAKPVREFDRPSIFANFKNLYKVEWLPLDSLKVPESYQRELEDSRVMKIAEDMNEAAVNTLLVVDRNFKTGKKPSFFLIDGEHRKGALYICGHTHWHCSVIQKHLTEQEEADIWVECNKNRKNGSALQLHHVNLIRKVQSAMDIKKELARFGWEVPRYAGSQGKNAGYGIVHAVGELNKIHAKIGRVGLRQVLQVLNESWGGLEDRRIHDATFLRAVFMLVSTEVFQKDTNWALNHLISRLSTVAPSKLEQKAKNVKQQVQVSMAHCLAVECAKTFNTRKQKSRRIIIE